VGVDARYEGCVYKRCKINVCGARVTEKKDKRK